MDSFAENHGSPASRKIQRAIYANKMFIGIGMALLIINIVFAAGMAQLVYKSDISSFVITTPNSSARLVLPNMIEPDMFSDQNHRNQTDRLISLFIQQYLVMAYTTVSDNDLMLARKGGGGYIRRASSRRVYRQFLAQNNLPTKPGADKGFEGRDGFATEVRIVAVAMTPGSRRRNESNWEAVFDEIVYDQAQNISRRYRYRAFLTIKASRGNVSFSSPHMQIVPINPLGLYVDELNISAVTGR